MLIAIVLFRNSEENGHVETYAFISSQRANCNERASRLPNNRGHANIELRSVDTKQYMPDNCEHEKKFIVTRLIAELLSRF